MASTEPNAETAKDHIALISVEKIISRLISQALFLLEKKKKLLIEVVGPTEVDSGPRLINFCVSMQ